jgi:hypothetical protein
VIHILSEGQLIDQGTYQDLISRNVTFQQMAKLEALQEESSG